MQRRLLIFDNFFNHLEGSSVESSQKDGATGHVLQQERIRRNGTNPLIILFLLLFGKTQHKIEISGFRK